MHGSSGADTSSGARLRVRRQRQDFRDDAYPEYKANRAPMPEDLAAQIEPLKDAIAALGWPVLAIEGVEADDVIATLAEQAKRAGWRSVISTGDKDLAQLVDERVTLVNTMSNEKLDGPGVREKFGVPPERIVDYLALTGDVVDNVPGVPKVGPKTAAKWLQQYGSLDEVMAHAGEIPGAVGENLRKTLDWLPKGRSLLTVKRDVELPVKLDDLADGAEDPAQVTKIAERFGFRSWVRAPAEAPPAAAAKTDGPAKRKYICITNENALSLGSRFLKRLRSWASTPRPRSRPDGRAPGRHVLASGDPQPPSNGA